ncbi:T9SS type A sorting domain-containing protein [Ochrovirga pacifica]|uniref:T9SS type A sorting domain-containing protein n=1 Tax=Ochrovirga pacifica TaxID=1042376 RepID=UPI000255A824|nr:T9SS type A sorting domain-containing protein [Ochrovirga pacifica]
MKRLLPVLFGLLMSFVSWAQHVEVTEVSGFAYPKHRDHIGLWARGETLNVKGTYTETTAQVVRIRLLTFAKGTWSNPLQVHQVEVATQAPYNGLINHQITVPQDYLLSVGDGDHANTQMLQVSVSFNGHATVNYNYFLNIVASRPSTTLIDFDALYPTSTGSTLVSNIQTAISNAREGDTLLFKSAVYNFQGKSFAIDKAVCISGFVPTLNAVHKGAYGIKTSFQNLKQLHIRSHQVRLCHLELQAAATTPYVFVRVAHTTYGDDDLNGLHYQNLVFENLRLKNGKVQVFGGSGAGITFRQCSFENFSQGGYFLNRRGRLNQAPNFLMSHCFFKPDFDAVNYNVRAISLDAGNDEYPVVWNQNGSTITHCLLDGTGLGISSKCSYVNVTNNHFLGYRKDVDMIHIEEFGHHFLIDGNTFEHIKPARGLYIDRETQQAHDITITNNVWKGTYAWIISSNAPYNVIFQNNDFSQAKASNPNDITFDFTYDHGGESTFLAYELPTKNLLFSQNTGLSAKDGILAYKEWQGDLSNTVEYPSAKIQKKVLLHDAQSTLEVSSKYYIKNKATGAYLVALQEKDTVGLVAEKPLDSTAIWEIAFKYPYYHHLKNTATKNYLEVYRGYTLGDINNGTDEKIYAKQSYPKNQVMALPFWYFRKHEQNGLEMYELMPGGNERKSRLFQSQTSAQLEIAKTNGEPSATNAESLWILEPINSLKKSEPIETEREFSLEINQELQELVVYIHQPKIQQIQVRILNSLGQQVHQYTGEHSSVYRINTSNLATNVYMVVLSLNGKTRAQKILLY